jgi:class II lanthipeptide synthase
MSMVTSRTAWRPAGVGSGETVQPVSGTGVSPYRELIAGVLEATAVHSLTSYSWFGHRADELPKRTTRAISHEAARAYLLHTLQAQLYRDFYVRGYAAWPEESPSRMPVTGFTPFLQALSAANPGHGSQEGGWRVHGFEDDRVVVEREGLRLWVNSDDVLAGDACEVAANTAVRVRLPKELLRLSPGYYMALGDRGLPSDNPEGVVRFYWNLRSETASRFLTAALWGLNAAGLAFRLKVVNDPDEYRRCDAGVLYVRKPDCQTALGIVETVYYEVGRELKSATPGFTKRLARGLALAEDPGDGDSFGMHRCMLLAEGIVRAHEQGRSSLGDRLMVVDQCFLDAGLNLDAPFLNAGSVDSYALGTEQGAG